MINIPLRDNPDGYQVEAIEIRMWNEAYPGIDVEAEIRKMAEWCRANPRRQKTERGCRAFVVNWLNRCEPKKERKVAYAAAHRKFEPEAPKVMTKEIGMAALAALKKR